MAVMSRLASATGLVVAGILAAGVVGQLPALGVTRHGFTATPASPPQGLICPGPVVAVGAEGTTASALSATGRPVRTSGTTTGSKVTSTPLKRGGVGGGGTAPRLLSAASTVQGGALAGMQVEQVTSGDAAGLAAAACTAPVADAWLPAGATTTGRTSVLLLANPSAAAARVRLQVWTEDGPVQQVGAGEVAVPAGNRRAVSLAGLAPSAGGLVVRVVSTGARIGVALEQRTVRGLESGGVDVVGPAAAPARTQVIPGVRAASAAAVAETEREDDYGDLQPVVRVLLPGRRAADVAITVQPQGGGKPVKLGRRVAAGTVTDFPIPQLPDGIYSVRVASDRPLVAGARVSVVGDPSASTAPDASGSSGGAASGSSAAPGSDAGLVGGDGPVQQDSGTAGATGSPTSTARGIDLAWFTAARPLPASSVVAVGAAPDPQLTLVNPGPARTVRLSGATTSTLAVPAGAVLSAPVARGLVVLEGASGMTAAVTYAGAAAIAGYPVEPADQQARAVRVSQ